MAYQPTPSVGQPVPAEAFLDSFDVSGALLGRAGAKGRASLVQQDNGQLGNYGYRAGNWKLVRHDSKQAYNRRVEERLRNVPVPPFQLFDLSKDIGETNDLAAAHPEPDCAIQSGTRPRSVPKPASPSSDSRPEDRPDRQ